MIRTTIAAMTSWFRTHPAPDHAPVEPIEMTPVHVFPSGNLWGHHVEWMDWQQKTIWGHIDIFFVPTFRVGAVIAGEMSSGHVALFQIKTLDWQSNPRDMFFGTVEFVGYAPEEAP